MPNIKSSIRSVKTDAERRAKNAAVKSQIRTAARKTVEAVQVRQSLGFPLRLFFYALFYIMIVSFFIQLYFITPYGQIRGLLL